MKSAKEVSQSNILKGKRHRVMSIEAVQSVAAQEYTKNILSRENDDQQQVDCREKKIVNSKLSFKQQAKQQNGKREQIFGKAHLNQDQSRPSDYRVPISRRKLLALIDVYFEVVNSSSEDESAQEVRHTDNEINNIDISNQKSAKESTMDPSPPPRKKVQYQQLPSLNGVPDIHGLLNQIQQN